MTAGPDSVYARLCREALQAGSKTHTLYISRAEAHLLAREIIDNLRCIGIGEKSTGAVLRVLLSDTATMFNQPLRLRQEAPTSNLTEQP